MRNVAWNAFCRATDEHFAQLAKHPTHGQGQWDLDGSFLTSAAAAARAPRHRTFFTESHLLANFMDRTSQPSFLQERITTESLV